MAVKKLMVVAIFLMFIGIILSAFGAHGLKKFLPDAELEEYKTGASYLIYHAIALMAVAAYFRSETMVPSTAIYFVLAGLLMFSGSLFVLTYLKIQGVESIGKFGLVTPIDLFNCRVVFIGTESA